MLNADSGRVVGVRGGALGNALGAGTALGENVTAAELAVNVQLGVGGVALDRDTVTRGNDSRGGNGGDSEESLEHY